MAKQTLNDKMHSKSFPTRIVETDNGKGVIPSPQEYDEIMKMIPEHMLITLEEIRTYLALKHKVDFTDGMSTGIFTNLAANASKEREMLGSTDITPYWRTLRAKGELNEKYSGGIEGHQALLEAEGHSIIQKGKRFFVKDYQEKLFRL